MNILICGGAGYIGSYMAKMLASQKYNITIFDNLSTGHRQAAKWGTLVEGDLIDPHILDTTFKNGNFDAVMHFSAKSLVGESMANPSTYYTNNVTGTLNLLEAMNKHDVRKFVFSSSAATFGNPTTKLIDENHPQIPINPYGQTKLMVELILKDFSKAYGLNSVSLRYFNAAGADPDAEVGESHDPETHLIPNVLKSLLTDTQRLKIFGNDYETKDGTCVRDYIHICDLCSAHLQALDYMDVNKGAHGFNLGNGLGFSILEIINAAQKVTNKEVIFDYEDRRPGDPPTLVGDSSLVKKEFGWQPAYTEIEEIIETAWRWHSDQKF